VETAGTIGETVRAGLAAGIGSTLSTITLAVAKWLGIMLIGWIAHGAM
jgi:hypothetical protein